MTTHKDKTDWFKIGLGLFFFVGYFYNNETKINESELTTVSIIVGQNIQHMGGFGTKSHDEYRIFSSNYPSTFIIKTAGGMAANNWQDLDSINANDTLKIKIHNSRLQDLSDKSENVPIYSLQKNGREIYNVKNYNDSQKVYDKRWGTIFLIFGALFLLRGFAIISSKTGYIIGGLSLIILLSVRLLNIW